MAKYTDRMATMQRARSIEATSPSSSMSIEDAIERLDTFHFVWVSMSVTEAQLCKSSAPNQGAYLSLLFSRNRRMETESEINRPPHRVQIVTESRRDISKRHGALSNECYIEHWSNQKALSELHAKINDEIRRNGRCEMVLTLEKKQLYFQDSEGTNPTFFLRHTIRKGELDGIIIVEQKPAAPNLYSFERT